METVVLSDMHLTEDQRPSPKRPHWEAYKKREFFIDEDFARLLTYVQKEAEGPVELVLNGDIFDFDNILHIPKDMISKAGWLARHRGLTSQEWMSLAKIDHIIEQHARWFESLGEFLANGNRVVFIVGNHDMELLWPSVQHRVRMAVSPTEDWESWDTVEVTPAQADERESLLFCTWFYLSGEDTFITHGHQFDANCSAKDMIDPVISIGGKAHMRIPFGDIAERYMLNGMGYFNPHATDSFIRSGPEYARFFFRYMARTHPWAGWTWFWGAVTTLVVAMVHHWRPSMRDPLAVDSKVHAIAKLANGTPTMVRQLTALNIPSACTNPLRVLRELWLDRAFLLMLVIYMAWQFILVVNFAWPINPGWVLLPLAIFLPPYVVYALSVNPTVFRDPLLTEQRATLISRITGTRRIIFGHTHTPTHEQIGPAEYLNSGFWSPAFSDPECTQRIGAPTWVWIRPGKGGAGTPREANLYYWRPGTTEPEKHEASAVREGAPGIAPEFAAHDNPPAEARV